MGYGSLLSAGDLLPRPDGLARHVGSPPPRRGCSTGHSTLLRILPMPPATSPLLRRLPRPSEGLPHSRDHRSAATFRAGCKDLSATLHGGVKSRLTHTWVTGGNFFETLRAKIARLALFRRLKFTFQRSTRAFCRRAPAAGWLSGRLYPTFAPLTGSMFGFILSGNFRFTVFESFHTGVFSQCSTSAFLQPNITTFTFLESPEE